jgi:tetratricopeptide (TPR) repeat protein
MKPAYLLILGLGAAPVWADGCPQARDLSALDPLYEALAQAPNEGAARQIVNQMWLIWDDAPDEPSQEILNRGMQARAAFDFATALAQFDLLVAYCPFYAEGYNQRAFVNYLRQDYAAALPDLTRALELNPRHVGALSGRALSLLALGQDVEGQEALRDALNVNPWLPERRLLKNPLNDTL